MMGALKFLVWIGWLVVLVVGAVKDQHEAMLIASLAFTVMAWSRK